MVLSSGVPARTTQLYKPVTKSTCKSHFLKRIKHPWLLSYTVPAERLSYLVSSKVQPHNSHWLFAQVWKSNCGRYNTLYRTKASLEHQMHLSGLTHFNPSQKHPEAYRLHSSTHQNVWGLISIHSIYVAHTCGVVKQCTNSSLHEETTLDVGRFRVFNSAFNFERAAGYATRPTNIHPLNAEQALQSCAAQGLSRASCFPDRIESV